VLLQEVNKNNTTRKGKNGFFIFDDYGVFGDALRLITAFGFAKQKTHSASASWVLYPY